MDFYSQRTDVTHLKIPALSKNKFQSPSSHMAEYENICEQIQF